MIWGYPHLWKPPFIFCWKCGHVWSAGLRIRPCRINLWQWHSKKCGRRNSTGQRSTKFDRSPTFFRRRSIFIVADTEMVWKMNQKDPKGYNNIIAKKDAIKDLRTAWKICAKGTHFLYWQDMHTTSQPEEWPLRSLWQFVRYCDRETSKHTSTVQHKRCAGPRNEVD